MRGQWARVSYGLSGQQAALGAEPKEYSRGQNQVAALRPAVPRGIVSACRSGEKERGCVRRTVGARQLRFERAAGCAWSRTEGIIKSPRPEPSRRTAPGSTPRHHVGVSFAGKREREGGDVRSRRSPTTEMIKFLRSSPPPQALQVRWCGRRVHAWSVSVLRALPPGPASHQTRGGGGSGRGNDDKVWVRRVGEAGAVGAAVQGPEFMNV